MRVRYASRIMLEELVNMFIIDFLAVYENYIN